MRILASKSDRGYNGCAVPRSAALAPLPPLAEHQRTSPGFERYVELVAPGLTRHPEAFRGRVIVERDGYGWTTPKVEPTEIRGLLAVHLGVGADVDDDPLSHLGLDVRAVGLSVPGDAVTELVNLDLDGGYPADRVIAALRSRLGAGRFLVTAGSGREGRYRVLIHVVPVAVDDMVERVRALLEELGFPLKQGAAEVYPHPTKPSRLPFGSGGCRVFGDELQPLRRQHPLELTEVFLRLDRAELPPVTHGDETGRPAPASRRRRRRRRYLDRSAHSLEVLGWRRDGVAPGQRDHAVRELVVLHHQRGLTEPEAVEALQQWLDEGGLARSRLARSAARLRRYRDRDIPRRVRDYYARYRQARPEPVALTRREVAAVVALAQSRAGEFPEETLGTFMLRALRRFRAAAIAGWSVDGGLRVHFSEWAAYCEGLGQSRYREIRDACGIFGAVTGWLSRKRAPRPDDAHAQAWTTSFAFDLDAPSPRRPVGGDPRARDHYQAARRAVKRIGNARA